VPRRPNPRADPLPLKTPPPRAEPDSERLDTSSTSTMSQEQDFFSFDEALDRLRLKEEELKRLVSEGEIRAFREGETMKLRRADVEDLRSELMGGEIVDLEDAAGDLIFDEDADFVDPGMATEELTAADTLVEAEATEFFEDLEELDLDDAEELDSDEELDLAPVGARALAVEEESFSPLAMGLLLLTTLVMLLTFPLLLSQGDGHVSDLAKGIGGIFVQFGEQ
jgi:excisionase family DNA binding protein